MHSLRSRLIISHILPVLVLIPVIGIAVVYLLETQVVVANYTNELVRQSVLVANVASAYTEIWFDEDRAQTFVDQVAPQINANVMLLDPSGRLIVSSNAADTSQVGKFFNQADITEILNGDIDPHIHTKDSQVSEVLVPVLTGRGRLLGVIRLNNPLVDVYERMQILRSSTIWVLLGGLLVGILMGSILANDISRPLRTLTQAVSKMAASSQLNPIQAGGSDEIRSLEQAFNSLVERLQTLEGSRRRLLANLVHELGRPLGALHSAVKALRSGANEDPGLRDELLAGMDGELSRLHGLLDELAHLHEQVLGPMDLDVKPVEIGLWLKEVIVPWREEALAKDLKWQYDVSAELPTLEIDPDRMAQALGNLLSNAIRYSQPGGVIRMKAECDNQLFSIRVEDSGPGIRPEEQDKVFNAFFRGKAVQRFSDGMGLGLTIARDLVEAHHGKLTLESLPGQGSVFTILIPIEGIP